MTYAIETLKAEQHKWYSVLHEAERQIARKNFEYEISLEQAQKRIDELQEAIDLLTL